MIGMLQSRYYRNTLIEGPIYLLSGETDSRHKPLRALSTRNSGASPIRCVSLSLLDSIYLQSRSQNLQTPKPEMQKEFYTINLNGIDSQGLNALPGIGSYTARKIISYRNRLGGFISKYQLQEIPRIDSLLAENERFEWIIQTDSLKKINLNQLDVSAMYKHPYIGKEKTKRIQEYAKVHDPMTLDKFMAMRSLNQREKALLLPYLTF